MKIIHLNCEERDEDVSDHRTYIHNVSSFEIKASKIGLSSFNWVINYVEYCIMTLKVIWFVFCFSLHLSVCFTNKDSALTSHAGNIFSCAPLFLRDIGWSVQGNSYNCVTAFTLAKHLCIEPETLRVSELTNSWRKETTLFLHCAIVVASDVFARWRLPITC